MTIRELLNSANNALCEHTDIDPATKQNLASAQLDADVLLSFALNKPKSNLFSHADEIIAPSIIKKFNKLIHRRAKHEPVAYITGKKSFFGRDFIVNESVLIPRPDTETIVESALITAKNINAKFWFADIGTGSGAIAITLSAESKARVIASDISKKALLTARKNLKLHGIKNSVTLLHGDLLKPVARFIESLPQNKKPETLIICANLPYLTTSQWKKSSMEMKKWEPRGALDAGADGMKEIKRFLQQLKKCRAKFPNKLFILLEIDPSQTKKIKMLVQSILKTNQVEIIKDLSRKNRVVKFQL